MNLQLNEDQRQLQEAFARLFGNESTTARVRAVEPVGFDAALWKQCVEMGIPLMRLRESRGGGGLGLMDAVLLAEEAGRHLACAPIAETIVAAHLLATVGGSAASSWLARMADGSAVVTLALAPATAGATQLVPAAAVADAVLCLHDDRLFLVPQEVAAQHAANLGALPLARWALPQSEALAAFELARGPAARGAYQAAIDEWKLLGAAHMAAAARKALEDAAAYSRERKAFDRPIGGYQGLAHPLADSITDVDGARLLVWRAASLAGQASAGAAAAVSKAWWWASESAGRATVRAMRTFGGYGMTLEYDAQLYFRRVRSLALLPGEPAQELARLADRLWSEPEAAGAIADAGDSGIDFGYGPAAADYAEQARAFFESHLAERRDFAFHSVDGHDPAVHRQLAQAGLLYVDWPKAHGGAGRSPYEAAALRASFAQARWPTAVISVTDMVGKILMAFGSDAAKQELLPPLLAGTASCALGYTEPSCGSDIFAAKTRAVRDGDDWVIDGQKMFTSQGHIADHVLLLARTDPEAPKYAGLTLFIVPVDVPGYAVHEVKTLGNERTNITYYEALRVPDRYRVGDVNGGVKAMSAALTMEQSAGDFFVAELIAMIADTERWALAPGADGQRPIERDGVRRGLARAHVILDVADALSRRSVWAAAEGLAAKHHGPMAKLYASEALVSVSTELMALAAPESLLQESTPLGHLELQGRKAIQATIYGGTSEVQRSLIAEAALGMPRTRS